MRLSKAGRTPGRRDKQVTADPSDVAPGGAQRRSPTRSGAQTDDYDVGHPDGAASSATAPRRRRRAQSRCDTAFQAERRRMRG
jgi:hypothetical protein